MPEYSEYERHHQSDHVVDPIKGGTTFVEKEHVINVNESVPPPSLNYNQPPPLPPTSLNYNQPPPVPAPAPISSFQQPPYAPNNIIPSQQFIPSAPNAGPVLVSPPVPIKHEKIETISQTTVNNNNDNNVIQPQLQPQPIIQGHWSPERPLSFLWLLFIAIYWTITVIAPSIINKDLTHRHFYLWCIAAVAMLSAAYTIKDGKYPSGSSDLYPKGLNSIGRYSAFFLVVCILIDYFMLTYLLINNEYDYHSKKYYVARVALHSISLFWITLFFYQRFIEYNGSAAHISFWSEWIDVIISWIVIYMLHRSIDWDRLGDQNTRQCFDEMICVAYYIFVILKMIGWLFPMFLITRWGTMKNATYVSIHLVVLDLLTDLPIVVIILQQEAYRFHGIIFFDVFYKILLIIRAVAYNLVYFLWMQQGTRYNNHVNHTEIRTTTYNTVQPGRVL